MMNFLKRLCSDGFSEDAFKTLCSRKWSSFASASVPLPNDADFVAPKLFGFVRNLPASMQNAGLQLAVPVVVARLPEGKELGERSSRKRQFAFAKKALAAISDSGRAGGIVLGGLFAFYDAGGNFRLSLVSGTPDAATHKLRYNSFRRQSFYVSKGGTDCRTFIERLAMPADSFAALREIFSVEKLTKEFYAQVEAWFLRARERVRFPGAAELGKDELTHNSDMALRLITRLIFIWFLRAKKLVPEELFDKRKIDELLKYDDVNGSTYYKAILQNLFFATLNTKIGERGWVERRAGKQEYFRYKRFFKNDAKSKYLFDICANVPFVNGGLFENLDRADVRIDCFSNRKDNEPLLSVPDELFFDTEKGILPLLSRYNFTVEENAPADEDVSLAKKLVEVCRENAVRLAVAESLTGGIICSRLVDVPGASEVLVEGLITYTNASKVRRLHVKLSTLEEYGAVSKETAAEMTHGLLESRDADLGIATTGCAGPDSDEKGTPVGLAFVGVATRKGGKIYRMNLNGDRNYIRKCVANAAMFYALERAENKDKEN